LAAGGRNPGGVVFTMGSTAGLAGHWGPAPPEHRKSTAMSSDQFAARGRGIEEGYFKTKDADLVDKLRKVFETKRDKEGISKASGITNDEVLERLVNLSVKGEMLTAFKLYPLVEIVWADGSFDKAESEAVLSAATKLGVPPESDSIKRLKEWLERGPNEEGRAAWRMLASELKKTLNPQELATFRDDLLKYAHAVAEASGGLFGVFLQVSPEEKRVIEAIQKALS